MSPQQQQQSKKMIGSRKVISATSNKNTVVRTTTTTKAVAAANININNNNNSNEPVVKVATATALNTNNNTVNNNNNNNNSIISTEEASNVFVEFIKSVARNITTTVSTTTSTTASTSDTTTAAAATTTTATAAAVVPSVTKRKSIETKNHDVNTTNPQQQEEEEVVVVVDTEQQQKQAFIKNNNKKKNESTKKSTSFKKTKEDDELMKVILPPSSLSSSLLSDDQDDSTIGIDSSRKVISTMKIMDEFISRPTTRMIFDEILLQQQQQQQDHDSQQQQQQQQHDRTQQSSPSSSVSSVASPTTNKRHGMKTRHTLKDDDHIQRVHQQQQQPYKNNDILLHAKRDIAPQSLRYIEGGRYEIYVYKNSNIGNNNKDTSLPLNSDENSTTSNNNTTNTFIFDWICEQVYKILEQRYVDDISKDIDYDYISHVSTSTSSSSKQHNKQQQHPSTTKFPKNQHDNHEQYSIIRYDSPQCIKEAIIQYAIQQAKRDPRINNINTTTTGTTKSSNTNDDDNSNNSAVVYDNFSLIINYDSVPAQSKHMDILYPNYQYTIIITDQSPGTILYQSQHPIRTIKDIQKYVWKDISSTLLTAMEQNDTIQSLISDYGNVLCPNIYQVKQQQQCTGINPIGSVQHDDDVTTATYRTGTLLSFPGSQIHAGPACTKYRCVLFFSACPDTKVSIPYNPDIQYFAPLLCCEIITQLLYTTTGNNYTVNSNSTINTNITPTDRIYMLERFMDSINTTTTPCQNITCHLTDRNVKSMIQYIMNTTTSTIKNIMIRNNNKSIQIFNISHPTDSNNVFEKRCLVASKEDLNRHKIMKSEIRNTDILMSHDPVDNEHRGNRLFRIYIVSYHNEYTIASTSIERNDICNSILQLVHDTNGRFLQKDEDDDVSEFWYDIDNDNEVIEIIKDSMKRFIFEQSKHDTCSRNMLKIRMLLFHDDDREFVVPSNVAINTPNTMDVAGGNSYSKVHPGNFQFFNLIKLFSTSYIDTDDDYDKEMIYKSIIQTVRKSNGRFLQQNNVTGLWYEIGDLAARKKVYLAMKKSANKMKSVGGSGKVVMSQKVSNNNTMASRSTTMVEGTDILLDHKTSPNINMENQIYSKLIDTHVNTAMNYIDYHFRTVAEKIVNQCNGSNQDTSMQISAVDLRQGSRYDSDVKNTQKLLNQKFIIAYKDAIENPENRLVRPPDSSTVSSESDLDIRDESENNNNSIPESMSKQSQHGQIMFDEHDAQLNSNVELEDAYKFGKIDVNVPRKSIQSVRRKSTNDAASIEMNRVRETPNHTSTSASNSLKRKRDVEVSSPEIVKDASTTNNNPHSKKIKKTAKGSNSALNADLGNTQGGSTEGLESAHTIKSPRKSKIRRGPPNNKITIRERISQIDDREFIPPTRLNLSTPSDLDVVAGLDNFARLHPGNLKFKELLNLHHDDYLKAKDENEKEVLYNIIIRTIREANGRFLSKDANGLWNEMGDKLARKKCYSAMRIRSKQINITQTAIMECKNQKVITADGTTTEMRDSDVLSGSCSLTHVQPGNFVYREVMDGHVKVMLSSNDYNPRKYSEMVVRQIMEEQNGRFLIKDKHNVWHETDSDAAVEKTIKLLISKYLSAKAAANK